MKTLYINALVQLKQSTPEPARPSVVKYLEKLTETKWDKISDLDYSCKHFDLFSNLKSKLIYYLIEEVKDEINFFYFKLYPATVQRLPTTILYKDGVLKQI